MELTKKTALMITLLGCFTTFSSLGNVAFARESGRRPPSPPPEAYTACEGKSAGDRAEFESPRGDMVTGTCEEEGDRLVLRPDNPPPRGGRPDNND